MRKYKLTRFITDEQTFIVEAEDATIARRKVVQGYVEPTKTEVKSVRMVRKVEEVVE